MILRFDKISKVKYLKEGVIKKTYQFYFRVSDTYEINDYWVHLMDHHINFAEKDIAFIKIGNAIYMKKFCLI